MEYGRALERLIREVVIANPALGPVHVLKADFSEGFYRIVLCPTETHKLGLVFTSEGEGNEFVYIPLTLLMEKKSPPIFCTAMETVEDLENSALSCNTHALLHKIYDMAEAILREKPPTLQPVLKGLTRDLYLMRANAKPVAYVDVLSMI